MLTPQTAQATTLVSDAGPAPRSAVGGDLDLIELGRIVRSHVPLLAMVNLLLALALAAVATTTVSVAPLAPLMAALLLGPIWLGATALSDRLLAGDEPGIRDLFGAIRRHARTGLGLALVPATVATLLLGSVGILTATEGAQWLLIPIAVDAAVLTVLAFGCIAAFPLAVATGLRGRERWFAAIALAGQDVVASLAVAAVVILLALSTRPFGPFVALVAAGPYCLLVTAVARRAIARAAR